MNDRATSVLIGVMAVFAAIVFLTYSPGPSATSVDREVVFEDHPFDSYRTRPVVAGSFRQTLNELRTTRISGKPVPGAVVDGSAVLYRLIYSHAPDDVATLLPALAHIQGLYYDFSDPPEYVALYTFGGGVIESVDVNLIHPSDLDRWKAGHIDSWIDEGFALVENRGRKGTDEGAVDWPPVSG